MQTCPRCERCYDESISACIEDGEKTRSSFPPGPPIIAERYQLERLLGRDWMGRTYLAHDLFLHNRPFALILVPVALLSSDDAPADITKRFEKFAIAAASIEHPNILSILDFGKTIDGSHFFLLAESISGQTLQRLLRSEILLPPQRALSLISQIAAGLCAAHEEGLLHLDLRPETIYVIQTRPGGKAAADNTELVKVAYFSLQAWTDDGNFDYGLTGTPTYTAPEQISRATPIDARSDVYSLGSIAYQMLCGRPPFDGDLITMLQQKVMETPSPLRSIRPEIPESLERVVMKALSPDIDARPGTMSEWLDQLEEVRRELHEARILGETLASTKSSASVITGNEVYDVFISYRRQTSSEAARLIRSELLSHKLRVFLDVEELGAGHFDTTLLQCIARTPNFIVVLAPNSLERCRDEKDWLRQEIVQAINNRKTIIPVTMPGFDFPPPEQLPSEMSALQLHQRVRYDHDYFDAMINRILKYLRTTPLESK